MLFFISIHIFNYEGKIFIKITDFEFAKTIEGLMNVTVVGTP